MKFVRLKKLSAAMNPAAPTPEMANYKAGEDNGEVSLPVEYTVEGYLAKEVIVGEGLLIDRISRNGIMSKGITNTSPVVKQELLANGATIYTTNSVYLLEVVAIQAT